MELKVIFDNVIEGAALKVEAGIKEALADGVRADVILKDALIAAMDEVGKRFEEGEFFVPEMLIAARAMQASMVLLKPKLIQSNVKSAGKVIIGTVKGDLHDIGKNLVALMLEGAGFEIVDLGSDVAPDKFVEAVRSQERCLVALSALLTTTMPSMKNIIDAIVAAGLRQNVKIMVGGAPVTETFAKQVGADGYASDASKAVTLAHQLVKAA